MIERGEDLLGRTGDADIIGNCSDLDVAGRILRTVQETSGALAEVEGARRVTLAWVAVPSVARLLLPTSPRISSYDRRVPLRSCLQTAVP